MFSNPAVKVEGLCKSYHIYDTPRDRLKQFILPRIQTLLCQQPKNYFHEFWALRDVSFEIKKGETVGIIGCNGSGKSTLLQMISGTLNPTAGSCVVRGRIAALLELGSGFNMDFTGRENVYMNATVLGLSQEEINARYGEIVRFADIGDFMEQPVKTYSSGMLVRLAFAVSVCVEPDILIVDEALAVGDAAFQFKCLDRLRRLTNGGTTLLFVSHDMGMVKNFCSHVIYLHQGTIKACGVADEMAERYFLDIRDEQRRGLGMASGVVFKPFLGSGKGIAFGTDEGCILSAAFTNTNGTFSSYIQGEEIGVRIKAKVRSTVTHPSLSVIIQDRRLMEIGGAFFFLECTDTGDGWLSAEIGVRWCASLAAGRYNITLRLENREGQRNFQPIDKQVGVMNFEVIEEMQTFLGIVDLKFSHLDA